MCKGAQGLLRSNTWSNFVQSRLVPAQYFRDPAQIEDYLEHSNFLADINNEREAKNSTYKKNLGGLERFTMVMFEEDETVVPKESSWWAEVDEEGKVTGVREGRVYKEDWLGLRSLDEKGALRFETTEGGHMQLGSKVLKKTFKENFGKMGRSFDKGEGDGVVDEEEGEEWRLEL